MRCCECAVWVFSTFCLYVVVFVFRCTNVSLVASLFSLASSYGKGAAFPPGVWKVGAAVRGWRCRQDKARPRGSSFELIFVSLRWPLSLGEGRWGGCCVKLYMMFLTRTI